MGREKKEVKQDSMHAPIVIFAYNRVHRLRNLIGSLRECRGVEEHDCFIFCDAPSWSRPEDEEKVEEVKKYIGQLISTPIFKSTHVINAEKHKGLRRSVIDGVTEVINKYGCVIDLEDDLVVSKDYLCYMDDALRNYRNDERVWAVTGFSPDIDSIKKSERHMFLLKRVNSWGFGTWKDRWEKVDWELREYDVVRNDHMIQDRLSEAGYDVPAMLYFQMESHLDSWAIYWAYAASRTGQMTLYPKCNMVLHMGDDGVHVQGTNIQQRKMEEQKKGGDIKDCIYDDEINEEYRKYFMSKENYVSRSYNWGMDKFIRQYKLLHRWMLIREKGVNLDRYFNGMGYRSIAVYGAGELAIHLLHELENTGIKIKYFVDKKKRGELEGKVIKDQVDEDMPLDAFVITPIVDYWEIKKDIRRMFSGDIVSIEQIIYS